MDGVYGGIHHEGKIFVTGSTQSDDLPTSEESYQSTYQGNTDGYIARMNASSGAIEEVTYLGTDALDLAFFIDVDGQGDIYLIGQTKGYYPISDGVYSNPGSSQYIHKISPDLHTSLLSTTIGDGSNQLVDFVPTAFMVDGCGAIYAAGWGGNVEGQEGDVFGLPLEDPIQSSTDGTDFYVFQLSPQMEELLFGSYFGGPISFEHLDGGMGRFDENGILYQAVCASCGGYQDLPTTTGPGNLSFNCNVGTFKMQLAPIAINTNVDLVGSELISQANPNFSFQWHSCSEDTIPLAGETQNTLEVTENGSYLVQIHSDYCSLYSSCINVVVDDIEHLSKRNQNSTYIPIPEKTKCLFNLYLK
jgi:hypothetical protein